MISKHGANDLTKGDKSFASAKITGNILSLGAGEIAARLVAFVGTAYLARELGPSGFGIIGFAMAICGYLSIAVTAGFNNIGAREVARRPQEASAIAASVTLVRLGLAFIAFAVITTLTWTLNKPLIVKQVVVLTGLSFFSLALDTSWVYKGLERNRPVGLALILGQILYVGTILLVVKNPKDVIFVPLAQFFGEMSAAFLLAVSFFRFGKIKWDFREGLNILKNSGFLTLTRLLRTLIFTFDVVLIGFLIGEWEVGIYTASYRICFLLLAIANAIHVSYLPVVARALAQGVKQVGYVAERSIEFSAAVAAPVVVGGMILARPVLHALFGSEFAGGESAFRLLILSIGFIFIHGDIHNVFLSYNCLGVEAWIMGSAVVLNIVLNIILIPHYGLVGAAFATAAAEGLILCLSFLIIYRMGVKMNLGVMLRPLLAAGIMGVGLNLLGPDRYLILYGGTGFFIYVFSLVIFRGIPQDAQPYLRKLVS